MDGIFLKLASGVALIIGSLEIFLNGNYIGGGAFAIFAAISYRYSKPKYKRSRNV